VVEEEVVDQEEVEVGVEVDQNILGHLHLTLLDIIEQGIPGEPLVWEQVIGEVVVEEGVEVVVEGVEVVTLQMEDPHQEHQGAVAPPVVKNNQLLAFGPTTS
jgi:hypothetical protein